MKLNTDTSTCSVCGSASVRYRYNWLYRCMACGFFSSSLDVHINLSDLQIDEQKREYALHGLRVKNFETILDLLAESGLRPSARILDIGCGHGWFLSAARSRGYQPLGIEPDVRVAAMARATGAAVRTGYFPNA